MTKLTTLTLEQLYSKEKKTKAVELAIIEKSTFTSVNKQYCDNICKLKCKSYNTVSIRTSPVDILIIQDHQSPAGRFDRTENQQEDITRSIIQFICEQAGFAGLTYRLTNLLKCAPSSQDFPLGKPPTQTTLQKCFPYLHEELIQSKPKVIISLGTATTKALGLAKHSNTGNRGEIAFSEYGPVVITLHPRILTYIRQNARGAAGMWGPDYMKIIERDFKKANNLVRGTLKYTPDTLKTTVEKLAKDQILVAKSIEDVKHITSIIKTLPEHQIRSFDTETTSLDPLDPTLKLLSIQFGWRDSKTGLLMAGVIPLWHRDNTFYNPDEAWKLVEPLLTDESPKVGHNSKYDILVIYWSKGVRVKNVLFDTLLIMHSVESGTQSCYGLKTACWDHLVEMGFAGYEESLGDLKKLKKEKEKALAELSDKKANPEMEDLAKELFK